jgi:membrane fusion protein (multidrug efflux system)
MNMKIKTIINKSLVIVLSLFLTTFIMFAQTGQQKEKKCPKTVQVLVGEVQGETFLEYKYLEKAILPERAGGFTSPMPGAIKTIETRVGDDVKTGDVLMLIDEAPIQKEIAAAKAQVKKWEKELWRRQHWKVRKASSENQAQQNLKKYNDLLAQKQEALKNNRIQAPLDGRIAALNVSANDHISQGFVLGTIVNIDNVKVLLQEYTDKVSDGQKIEIKVKELAENFTGVVSKADDGSTYIVVSNSDKKILPGMNAQFRILVKEHQNAVVLPQEKILKDAGGAFVYVVQDKWAKRAALKIGPTAAGKVLILDGLSPGDEMIAAEILSAKQATLEQELTCVKDNKKIKPMVLDEAKGKFVTLKKGVKPVPVQEVSTPVVKQEAPPKMETKPQAKTPEEPETPAAPQKKAEPDKGQKDAQNLKVDALIDYLINNKDTLKYKKFKVRSRDGVKMVRIDCNATCRDKLLPVIAKFGVEKQCIIKVAKEKAAPRTAETRRPSSEFPGGGLNKLRVGALFGYQLMTDTNFKDVYGNMPALGLDISYTLSDKLDLWLYGGTGSKTAPVDWAETDLEFKFTAFTLDLRYFFKRNMKWDFFAGAGLNVVSFKDTNPILEVKDNAIGFNLLAGTYYHLTEKLLLHLALRLNMVKKAIPDTDNDLNMNSAELLLGISYNL